MEIRQVGIAAQRARRQVQQPGRNHAAAPPDLGNLRDIDLVAIVLRMTQRRGLGIDLVLRQADIGIADDVEPFRIGGHQAVFDAVVHHLDEMPRAIRSAMQVAELGRAGFTRRTRCARRGLDAGRQGAEDRIEMPHNGILAADHVAIAPFQPPYAAADADIDIVQTLASQFAGAANVVVIVRVAALDDDVARLEQRHQRLQHGIHHRGRQHHPDRAWLGQGLDEVRQDRGALRALCHRHLHGIGVAVIDHAVMSGFHQSLDHVGAHAPEPDHAKFHYPLLTPRKGSTTLSGRHGLPGRGDNAIDSEAEMLRYHLHRRRQPERAHPQNDAGLAGIALPAERRTFLDGNTRRHCRRQHGVAIRRFLRLEQFP